MQAHKENISDKKAESDNGDNGEDNTISDIPGPTASDSFIDEDGDIHSGNMIIDATCCDTEVKYPINIDVLHDAIRVSVRVIESLSEITRSSKPKTFMKAARKKYLAIVKKKGDVP